MGLDYNREEGKFFIFSFDLIITVSILYKV